MIYAFWNNKGGTGKTSLLFQAACRFAEIHPDQRILAVDLCPQANLSELFLGGIEGGGSGNLARISHQSFSAIANSAKNALGFIQDAS